MSYDQNEIENYILGSDLWAGDQDPVLHLRINEEVFWKYVLLRSTGFRKHLDCPDNRATVLAVYCQRNPGQPIIASELSDLILKLIQISYPGLKDPNARPAEPIDSRPRDRNGRLMSPKAIQWKAWEEWVNNPETSSRQVELKKNADPEFREFFSTMLRREINANPVGDGVEGLNGAITPTRKAVAEDVQLWAQDYRTRSIAEIRRVLSPAMVGATVAAENQRLFDAAQAAGLI
jgi:hypothetical protein